MLSNAEDPVPIPGTCVAPLDGEKLMSHDIEANRYAHAEGEPDPWHVHDDEGIRNNVVPLTDVYDIDAALTKANMDIHYEKFPVETVPGLYGIRRKEDGHVLPGTGVGEQYEVLQLDDVKNILLRPFFESKLVRFSSAGIVKAGARFFICAKVEGTEADVLPGDAVRAYLNMMGSWDGSLVTGIGFGGTRVVCANTLAAFLQEALASGPNGSRLGLREGPANLLRVKHTKGQRVALAQVGEIIDFATRSFAVNLEQYRVLANTPMVKADLDFYVRESLGITPDSDGEYSTKGQNIIDSVLELADSGIGTDIRGVRGTAWAAYNAVTEHYSHHAGRSVETRTDAVLFGDTRKRIAGAFQLALDMVRGVVKRPS